MENQHRKIKGYRELSEEEIALMNLIKEKAAEVGGLVERLSSLGTEDYPTLEARRMGKAPDHRWLAIGKTNLQQGFMALTRAIAKPDFF